MSFDWYPFDPIKFRRATYHLNPEAECIYRRLIDEYMITRRPLPDSDLSLAGIARVAPEVFNAHSATLRAFFTIQNGKLHQETCDEELHAQSMLAAKRSKKAKEAATVRWGNEKQKQRVICREHSRSIAKAMLNDATLHNKSISLTKTEFEAPGTSEKVKDPMLVASSELALSLRRKA